MVSFFPIWTPIIFVDHDETRNVSSCLSWQIISNMIIIVIAFNPQQFMETCPPLILRNNINISLSILKMIVEIFWYCNHNIRMLVNDWCFRLNHTKWGNWDVRGFVWTFFLPILSMDFVTWHLVLDKFHRSFDPFTGTASTVKNTGKSLGSSTKTTQEEVVLAIGIQIPFCRDVTEVLLVTKLVHTSSLSRSLTWRWQKK